MTDPIAERYLRLGLQLGRHDPDLVDSYIGPPELAAAVEAQPAPRPAELVADAQALLDELDPAGCATRCSGVHTHARLLAGERLSFGDQGEGCYGYRPEHTDESVFQAAQRTLDELLPGDGALGRALRAVARVRPRPAGPDRGPCCRRSIAEARVFTERIVDLPGGEEIELELVHDRPGSASTATSATCAAGSRSTSTCRARASSSCTLAIHETYPGHQAERASRSST